MSIRIKGASDHDSGAVCTARYSTKDRWESFRGEVEKRAAAAKRIAEKNHLLFVPLQKKFDDALLAAPAEYWLDDGVHPTPAGHQIIKNAWIEAFEQLRR